jgi:predicted amidohydrolase
MPETKPMRLAVAQVTVHGDPRDAAALRDSGQQIRRLMRDAHQAGARLVHFPEGATTCPNKKTMSVSGPEQVGPADWERVDWAVLRDELAATMAFAGELRLWTVLGSVHRLTPPHRPHNSLYVISDRGNIATRYDERMLSSTKVNHLYTPGSVPVIFDVDGVRLGCAPGMEATFPEMFLEYERLGVYGVLFSTHGPGTPGNNGPFALQAQAHAASNSYWVSYAGPTQDAANASSGVISPDGEWIARCPQDTTPSIAIADLDDSAENHARPWRRTARNGIYNPHLISDDPRSQDRATL